MFNRDESKDSTQGIRYTTNHQKCRISDTLWQKKTSRKPSARFSYPYLCVRGCTGFLGFAKSFSEP